MKKVLFASTALVAFGLAGVAQAADPIKLGLGGYSKWVMGYSDNDLATDMQGVDIKGTNEVFFKGSTTLDNGIKIGVQMELEAGGHTDQTTDVIDESYVTVDGAFGRLIVGTRWNGAYLLHVSAPSAASFAEDSELGLNSGIWVTKGSGINTSPVTTAIDTTNKNEKITYVAPSFAGFTVGASYIPNLGNEDDRTTQVNSVSDIFGVAANYNNTFGGFGVKASVGFAAAADDGGAVDHHREVSTGLQLGYAGFTVGGAYRKIWQENNAGVQTTADSHAWTAGVGYASGPFGVSFDYYNAEARGGDSIESFQFEGKYNIGPGVDLIGMVGYADFNNNWADYNDGWVVAAGIALAY